MSFDSVAKAIIADAIATAVCVDDKFPEPYSEDGGDDSTPRELYRAFRAERCVLDVYRFREMDRWREDASAVLADKDLLILDWELAEAGVKYKDALAILSEAVDGGTIPFVYIYTHATDLQNVAFAIRAHFCAAAVTISRAVKDDLEKFLGDSLDLADTKDIRGLANEFFDLVMYPDGAENARARIRETLASSPGADSRNGKHLYNLLLGEAAKARRVQLSRENRGFLEEVVAQALYGHEEPHASEAPFNCVESVRPEGEKLGRYTFLIGRTLVRVVQRDEVPPGEVPADLSETIRRATRDRFLRLLSLEMRTLLRKGALRIANGLDGVDELAFFHHAKKVKSPAAFEEFVKELWRDQLGAFVMMQTPKLLAELDTYKAEQGIEARLSETFVGGDATENPLATLNFYYSNLHVPRDGDEHVRFGDIFRVLLPVEGDGPPTLTDNYLLCITAHCDCLRPSKIHHTFMFVFGRKVSLDTGLEAGDEGHHSYVRIGDTIICIEWTAKPFTIYIPEYQNRIEEISSCLVRGEQRVLRHVSYQKDSYTQRIANHALGQAMRVGVDFAQFPHKEEVETG